MLNITSKDIDRALACLNRDEVIVFPTETSYGIGCDATSPQAVERVFSIKGRPEGKGTPLILPCVETAGNYIVVTDRMQKLMDAYWPGPLNIIGAVAKGSSVASQCAQDSTQAVRVSSHPFCSILARSFGKPIVASSANVSGKEAAYSIQEVRHAFAARPDKPDCLIDGGVLPELAASTTIKVIGDICEVVRQGSVVIEE